VPSLIPVYHSSSIADLWPCHTLTGFGSRRLPTVDVGVTRFGRYDWVGEKPRFSGRCAVDEEPNRHVNAPGDPVLMFSRYHPRERPLLFVSRFVGGQTAAPAWRRSDPRPCRMRATNRCLCEPSGTGALESRHKSASKMRSHTQGLSLANVIFFCIMVSINPFGKRLCQTTAFVSCPSNAFPRAC
jgi:hypothetical protein